MAVADYAYTASLKDGRVGPAGIELEPVEVKPIIAAFRRMIRSLEFDLCEVAVTTYLVARSAGIPLIALPIFLNRKFHHGDVTCRGESGIAAPKDLEGRRVGVRAYSVTTGVWVRGMLAHRYGVDLSKVTWVVDDEEHVQSIALPGNVVHVPAGASIAELFEKGEIDAALSGRAGIGRRGAPGAGWDQSVPGADVGAYPLFDDAARLDAEWFRDSGIYPIHGVLTARAEVVRERAVVVALLRAFEEAKAEFLEKLADPAEHSEELERYRRQSAIVGPDPLPYGVDENRTSIAAIIGYAREQGLLPDTGVSLEELFVGT